MSTSTSESTRTSPSSSIVFDSSEGNENGDSENGSNNKWEKYCIELAILTAKRSAAKEDERRV